MGDSKKGISGMFSTFRYDFPSSLVVFFVAVPLCLGIALASGAPLFSGIIAGIVGGIVVGAISNSSLGVSGPAAGLTVIVLNSIEKMGTFEAFLLTVVLAGVIQVTLGVVKAGIIGYYFPTAVIKGMLAAIGIIIILKQIPHAVGYDADYEGDLTFIQPDGENTFTELIHMIDAITPGAIIVCFMAVAILFIWETHLSKKHAIFKLIQGPLVAVVVGIVYQMITVKYYPGLSLETIHLVNVPVADDIPSFFGQFTFPDFNGFANSNVWIVASTIAIVASLETLLSVEATDKLDPNRRVTNTNRELIAQGSGNIVAGLIGGLPVTQVIVRSSANVQSGGKSKLSTILHGILLLLCVVAIPQVLNMVPLAVLAAILFSVGFKLAKPASFFEMYKLGWSQFLPFIVTVIGVVSTDLLKGIGMGLGVAVIFILRNSYLNSHFLHLESKNDGSKHIKMTLAEEVYFLNKGAILSALNKIKDGSHVTIDASRSISIDYDVMEVIEDFKRSAKAKNIRLEVITQSPKKEKGANGVSGVNKMEAPVKENAV